MRKERIGDVTWYQFENLEGVRHGFLTRQGGVSEPPFDTLNLGHTVGDDLAAVEENHRRALAALDVQHEQVVSPFQVHGSEVHLVTEAHTGTTQPATDGLITTTPGVALLLRFADCVPLLMYDPRQRALALVHSGWKGTVKNIAGAAVAALARHAGSRPEDVWAGIGPAIGPCCYRVSQEVVDAISRACPPGTPAVREENGALHLDLPEVVSAQLKATGVRHVTRSGLCTACDTETWFSYRAADGCTGRFGVLAMLA